jgi:hypothetical protein
MPVYSGLTCGKNQKRYKFRLICWFSAGKKLAAFAGNLNLAGHRSIRVIKKR